MRAELGWYQRALVFVVGSIIATFIISVVMMIAPLSPVTYTARSVTDDLLGSQFEQLWTLFSPNPPDFDADILFQTRCEGEPPSRLFELSRFLRGNSRKQGLFSSYHTAFTITIPPLLFEKSGVYWSIQRYAVFDNRWTETRIRAAAESRARFDREAFRRFLSAAAMVSPARPRCPLVQAEVRGVVAIRPLPEWRSPAIRPDRLFADYDSGWESISTRVAPWQW